MGDSKETGNPIKNLLQSSRPETGSSLKRKHGQANPSLTPIPLENRIAELEERVFFREQEPVPRTVYCRLKELEDRLEELVGLSPEYCSPLDVVWKRDTEQTAVRRKEARKSQISADLKNINARVVELTNTLKEK